MDPIRVRTVRRDQSVRWVWMRSDKGGQQGKLASSWSELNEDKYNRSRLESTFLPPLGLGPTHSPRAKSGIPTSEGGEAR